MWGLKGCLVLGIALCLIQLLTGQRELGDIDLGCPQGSYRYGNYCFVIFQTFVTFEEAEIICETGGGVLAPITDNGTQYFMQKLRIRKFLHRYWFGLNDKRVEGEWVFSDNTRLSSFSKWHRGEPNNYNKNQHCAEMWLMNHLEWDDEDCARKLLYVCEYDGVNCTDTLPHYGRSCYELSQDLATYDEAELNCQIKGGFLASIKTEGTFNFLKSIIYADKFWLNMTEKHMQVIYRDRGSKLSWITDTWIGTRYTNGEWIHSDGSAVGFTNWAPGEPHPGNNQEDCVKLGDQWNDVQCDLRHSFICRYEARKDPKIYQGEVPCIPREFESRMASSAVKEPLHEDDGINLGLVQFIIVLVGCGLIGMLLLGLAYVGFLWHRRLQKNGHSLNDDQDLEVLQEQEEDQA